MTHAASTFIDTAPVRDAARKLGQATDETRSAILRTFAAKLRAATAGVLAANADDVARGVADGLSAALIDRLTLTPDGLEGVCSAVEDVAALPDPLAEVLEERTLANGLQLTKVRVPFGVVCVVYEARPNVTADAAAIAIRTGNGAVLRGSRQAQASNSAIIDCVHAALSEHDIDPACIMDVDPADREGFRELIATEGSVDLVIPRGGEGLKKFLYEHARVPILAAAGGNCHVFVDKTAEREMARDIVLNAKTHRPGVCNSAETLLVHEARAHDLLPYLLAHLNNAGVEVVEGEEALATEFLDMKIAVTTVASVEEAIAHINKYGTGHSEAIVTGDGDSADKFVRGVDAAAVYVNASTRFTDGAIFGMGAEVGISTNKLHARGPIGLRELTTTKYIVYGDGQIR
ncbi:MAG: glutamate-5-semialdehyde dehydrogenase [Thermoleophilia bacterium]|nr:glutamate-5-semialdehyde dehydrogenase [Thermoleophilia bacterium]